MNQLAAESEARGHVYGMLARLLRSEVDQSLLAELRAPAIREALRAYGVPLDCLEASCDSELLNELGCAYTHLFLLTLNPHESVQRGEGRLYGERAVAAERFLEEVGLAPLYERSLLPDHAAVELEVMEHLLVCEAERIAADDQEGAMHFQQLQRRFFTNHVAPWLIRYLQQASQAATHSFYGEFTALGVRFLRVEKEVMAS